MLLEGGITSFYEGASELLDWRQCVANCLLYRIIILGYTSVLYTSAYTLFTTDLYYTYVQDNAKIYSEFLTNNRSTDIILVVLYDRNMIGILGVA